MFQVRARLRLDHRGGDDAEVAAAGGDCLDRLPHGAAQVGPFHFDQVGGRQGVVVHGRDGVERIGQSGPVPGVCSAVELGQVRRQDAFPVLCCDGVERVPRVLPVLIAPVVFDQAGRCQAVAVGGVNSHKRLRHLLAAHPLGLLGVVLDQGGRHHALLRLGNLGVCRLRDFPPPLAAPGLPYGRQRRGDYHLMASRSAACYRVYRLGDPGPRGVFIVVHGQRGHDGGGHAITVFFRDGLERVRR